MPLALARPMKSLCSVSVISARCSRVSTAAVGRAIVSVGRRKLRDVRPEVLPRVHLVGDPREQRPVLDEQELEEHGDDDGRQGDEHERRRPGARGRTTRSRWYAEYTATGTAMPTEITSAYVPSSSVVTMRRAISVLTGMLFDTE